MVLLYRFQALAHSSVSSFIQFILYIDLYMYGSVFLRDVVIKLLQFEASTNLADSKGCFPLHLAAWRGDVDIVRILIHHGHSHCRVNQQVKPFHPTVRPGLRF